MKRAIAFFLLWIAGASDGAADQLDYDMILQQIVRNQNVRPLPTKPFEATTKYELGRSLFFDPLLSGNRDIACATCHLIERGTSDAQPFSIGTSGTGIGESRRLPANQLQQPRNALDLWNRDNNWAKSMFWDGRVEVLDPVRKIFRSPLGDRLPGGFDNVMAVQALFPLAQPDEMLGVPGDSAPEHLPKPHGGQRNELSAATASLAGPARIEAVAQGIMRRLIGVGGASRPWHEAYRTLFHAAYPNVSVEDLSIVHAANALSHFQEIAFATRQASWDAYLRGDLTAIDDNAKRGAFIFFGKGRCNVCHRGPLFSDFEYYAIGVKGNGPGIEDGDDMGRYYVTGKPADKYKFRTPPLRNVTLTAPYFHNGIAKTLDEAITQHLDPLYHADKYEESGAFAMKREQIEAISKILLAPRIRLSKGEIDSLKAFLATLEDAGLVNLRQIIPVTVPSGLPVPTIDSQVEAGIGTN